MLIRQGAPGEEQFWSVPSGAVEYGEVVTEALAREVLEETGLEIIDPGRLAFVVQIDNRRAEPLHAGDEPGFGYLATVWTFDEPTWRGELAPRDPDGLVTDARFVPVEEAIEHLVRLEWQRLTVAYLRGEVAAGSLHLVRWHPDGRVENVLSVPTSAR